jgi:2-iminoacetate synthase ThiH
MTPAQIARLVRAAGREPVERDTFYNPIVRAEAGGASTPAGSVTQMLYLQ